MHVSPGDMWVQITGSEKEVWPFLCKIEILSL